MKINLLPSTLLAPLAASAVLLATSLPAAAATDYFLKFDGIKGSSVSESHKDWIDLASFNWGLSVATATGSGAGSGTGSAKPVFTDFFWRQLADASVPALFLTAATGTHIKSAVADFTTNRMGKDFTYFKMSFEDVILSQVTLAGSTGVVPDLAGAFSYGKVTLDYWTLKPDGSVGSHLTSSYDLRKGTGSVGALAGLFAQGLSGPQIALVPEPASYGMLLAGLGVIAAVVRRRRLGF